MGRFVLPLQAVGDGYTYFSCPNTQFVTVQVFNNGIDIGYGQGISGRQGSAMYPPADEYLALQSATLPRSCDEIRFKNHVAGKPAQIQITTQGTDDLPSGNPLAVGISPNFLTVNPDGTVGANFTGLVNALGLILPAYTGSPGAQNRITWVRGSDGATVAEIEAGGQFIIQSDSPNAAESTEVRLIANGPAGTFSEIDLFGPGNEHPSIFVQAGGLSGSPQAKLIDDAGPGFAQLQNSGQFFIDSNNGNLYVVGLTVAAGSWGGVSFFTARPSWTAAAPLGVLGGGGSIPTPATLAFTFLAPNQFGIWVANNSPIAGTYSWQGIVVGH